MAVITSPFGSPVYGNYATSLLGATWHPWVGPGTAAAPPAPTFQQLLPLLESTLSAYGQVQQGWGNYGSSSTQPQAYAPPAPPAPAAAAAAISAASASSTDNASSSANTSSTGDSGGKGGLFGTGLLSGLFGADSPVLNMVHSILDPIPVVGDIANMICGVVSPAYHAQHEAEQAAPSNDAAVSVAYTPPPSTPTAAASGSSSTY